MSSITVHAGDFKKGPHHFVERVFGESFFQMNRPGKFWPEKLLLSQISSVEVQSEESVKKVAGTLGWGLVGATAFGPLGLLAGLISGGKGKEVTFVCALKDGRRFLATASSSLFTKMNAAVFK